jgi:glucose-1-phosphate cytidylyltransferase
METVVLAGGLGTRLAEETEARPKPMVEIGGRPILWHILTHYAAHGFDEFVVALGYKGDVVKRFFLEYAGVIGGLSVDLARGRVTRHDRVGEDWTVHLVDTGLGTNTGGRVKRLADWVGGGTFLLTYGDGLADVDLRDLVAFHRRAGTLATVTAVRPPARYGGLVFDGDLVAEFTEKPQVGEGWINGGFFVCEPAVLDYLDGDETSLECDALPRLAAAGQLAAYRHDGFWQCMDTLRDKRLLEALWQSGRAPWAAAPARPRRSPRPTPTPARTAK